MKKTPLRGPVSNTGSVEKIITVPTGKNPAMMAVNPVTKNVYVVNTYSNNVTVIDENNNTSTIAVQDTPTDVVVNPVTGNTYVMNSGSNSITAIYKNGYTENIPTWTSQYDAMAVNSVTNKLYVAHNNQSCVTVIDLSNNYINTIPAAYPGFIAIAVNEQTNKIYAANMNSDSNNVLVIDGKDNSTTTIQVGDYPSSIVVNPSTNRIYVGNLMSHNTSVIDGNTDTVIATISGPGSPPLSSPGPCTVSALNAETNKIFGFAQFKQGPYSWKEVFGVIDGTKNTFAEVPPPFEFAGFIGAIAVNSLTDKIYVAYQGTSGVLVYDGSNIYSPPTTIAVESASSGIAINAETKKVYVSNWFSNNVTIIEGN